MGCFGRLIGCLLVFIVIVVAPASIWIFTVWNVASSAEDYTDSLDDDAYESLALLAVPAFADALRQAEPQTTKGKQAGLVADIIITLEKDEWEPIGKELVSAEWVHDLINTSITSSSDYFSYETDALDIQIDFSPLGQSVEGERGQAIVAAIMIVVDSWESCTETQTIEMRQFLEHRSNTFPRCNPSSAQQIRLEEELAIGIDVISNRLKELPDYHFDLRQELAKQHDGSLVDADRIINEVRQGIFFVDNTLVVGLLIPIMLLSLVLVFAVRSAKEFFFWTGLTSVGVGLFTLAPLIPWIYGLINDTGNAPSSILNRSSYQIGFQFQRWLFGAFADSILAISLILLINGFILLILAAALRGPDRKVKQKPVYYMVPNYQQPSGSSPQPIPVQPTTFQTPPPTPKLPPSAPPPPLSPPRLPIQRKTPSSSTPKPTVDVSPPPSGNIKVITPKQMPSAADRYKAELDKADMPEDMTFIPSEPPEKDE